MKVRAALASLLLPLVALLFSSAARAATVVHASLQDPSNPGVSAMHIALDRASVPAGKVTFQAVNQSKDLVHELIVVRVDSPQATLPYDEKKQDVVEKRIHHLGEVPDLKPGRSGAMTLNLKPGHYLLICNQPGHYKAGMSAPFTVTQ